ncbi:hypothetical protein [Streptomyces sp. NBC_00091]|uniref:hypothetical protein n=1 Tax=Streptomyces sp. NBC_00091 TaxID=2975648 RepID=UPI00225BFD92|nr:hypothetical protein [Streptomyces sp. NBC_00091]MCX5379848.1 hypothetical protein [Streptomyces sp. NBC_00091]
MGGFGRYLAAALAATSVLLAAGLGSPGAGGVLMTAFAVGALAGSLTLGRMTSVAPGRLARWGMAGTGVALAAAAFAPSVALTAAAFAVAGVCDGPLLTATLPARGPVPAAGVTERSAASATAPSGRRTPGGP